MTATAGQEKLFIAFVTLTLFFLALTAFFAIWRHRLTELRSLRLGRLTILLWLSFFLMLNCLIAALITVHGVDGRSTEVMIGLAALTIELIASVGVGLLIGTILPIAILVLTIQMWRREAKSVANLLLPILMLLFFLIDWTYVAVAGLPQNYWAWLHVLSLAYPILALYLAWQFFVFYISSRAYGRRMKKLSADVFVVLGAGLIDGQRVGPLLANRIKAAVSVSTDKTEFIMSGGKGDDEHLAEAVAMKNYAVDALGISADRIRVEDASRTTYENLVNTAKMLADKKFLFFTSDFHVFRAALFAASLGLDAQGGRGGKTALYYRVPAFIREFIAVMNSERKKHMMIVGVIIALLALTAIFYQLTGYFVMK